MGQNAWTILSDTQNVGILFEDPYYVQMKLIYLKWTASLHHWIFVILYNFLCVCEKYVYMT